MDEELEAEYIRLAHALQSCVAAAIAINPSEDYTPKHLGTGVNMAMIENSVIVALLVSKGVFTYAEFHRVLLDKMRQEVKLYEDELGCKLE